MEYVDENPSPSPSIHSARPGTPLQPAGPAPPACTRCLPPDSRATTDATSNNNKHFHCPSRTVHHSTARHVCTPPSKRATSHRTTISIPRTKSALAATMLRRPPTTLHITAEDVAAYEDRRANEALAAAQQARVEAQSYAQSQAQMEGVQESPAAVGRRAREERLGITRRR
ncbi:Anaphase-promoting complex, subunit CDC26 [Metarhizium album ARSEF 1941]|uniref:Anaphase-promoting complex, subunit CDC26 n=1 Tax=Metarhizium album (strain ARSEF 1941) TaxID=1081103 RepID=A0A0B2WPL4_METAS|nr:Anaphase-promoting complex, subunit CDC26 [Metarhizium album ARSEF 1941]KHN95958.1 Anaphase-promoting complex, subunit CDC26 [Metarhizium album ARSEF 1941]